MYSDRKTEALSCTHTFYHRKMVYSNQKAEKVIICN